MFGGGEIACAYRCDWNDGIVFDDSRHPRTTLQRLVPSVQSATLDEFELHMYPTDFDELFEPELSTAILSVIER